MDGLHGLTPDEWLTRWRRAMNTVEDREVLRALREDFESNTRPHLAPGQVEEVLDSHSAAIARLRKFIDEKEAYIAQIDAEAAMPYIKWQIEV